MDALNLLEIFKKHLAENEGRKEVSDYLAAKRLGITQSTISHWRNRGGTMDEELAVKIADYCGLDRGEVVAWVMAARTKCPAAREALERLARLAHNTAAVVLLTVLLGMASPAADAAQRSSFVNTIHYAQYECGAGCGVSGFTCRTDTTPVLSLSVVANTAACFGRTHDRDTQHQPGVAWNRSSFHPPNTWRTCAACMFARRGAGAPTHCRTTRRSPGAAGDSVSGTARWSRPTGTCTAPANCSRCRCCTRSLPNCSARSTGAPLTPISPMWCRYGKSYKLPWPPRVALQALLRMIA